MKISSASKKVLASALSAAMVVAFTPTVAFGAISNGTQVTVNFDLAGGAIKDSSGLSSIPAATGTVAGNQLKVAVSAATDYAALTSGSTAIKKGDFTFAGWWYDVDGDGAYKNGTDLDYDASTGLAVNGDSVSGTSITLHARYNEPALNASTDTAKEIFAVNTAKTSGQYGTPALSVDNLKPSTSYVAKLAFPDGTTTVKSAVATTGGSATSATFSFSALTAEQQKAVTAGTYKMTVEEVGSDVVLTKEFKVVNVSVSAGAGYWTFEPGATTDFLVTEGTTWNELAKLTTPTAAATGTSFGFAGYYTAEGKQITGAYGSGLSHLSTTADQIKADTTLVAHYNNPQVSTASIAVTNQEKGQGTLSITAENLVAAGTTGSYSAVVSGPNGFAKTIKLTTSANKNDTSLSATLTFGQTWETDNTVTQKLEAGTYTVAISLEAAKVNGETQTLTDAQKTQIVDSKSTALVAATYDLDGGSWVKDDADAVKALPTLLQVGDSLNLTTVLTAAQATTVLKTPGETQAFDYWTVNGAKLGTNAAPTTVPAEGVAVKVVYKETKIAAPEVTFTAVDKGFKMTVAAAEGTVIKYATAVDGTYYTLPADGLTVKTDTNNSVWVKAVTTDGQKESTAVQYQSCYNYVTTVGTFADAISLAETSTSKANKPVRYGDTLTTLKKDAQDAVKVIGFQKASDWSATVAAQELSMLQKAAEIETANLEAMKDLTKSLDGKTYTYLSDAAYSTAKSAIDAVADAFDKNNNGANKTKDDVADVNGVTIVNKSLANNYVAALKAALAAPYAVTTTVAADVAEPAIEVSAQLQAAKTGEEAEAALTAYAALTDAQKALVDTADVTAAEKIVAEAKAAEEAAKAEEEAKKAAEEAAAALAAQQDQAAVNYVNSTKSKTVKLGKATKTKKAATIVWKSKVSASGNVVTYSWKSGSAKIKVAAAGTATLKKGTKAGTYKAKVLVTCGDATRTVNVKFVVK